VFVSLLPISTRPGAVNDRWHIIRTAHDLGLELQGAEPGLLRYRTPMFEATSLQAAGLTISSDWRSGDLITLRKVRDAHPDEVTQIMQTAKSPEAPDEWFEVLLGRRKVKLRGPFDDMSEPPALISIEPSDVLPTVSRRYERRSLVDLWLWDNRVFGVRGKTAFRAALRALAAEPAEPQMADDISDDLRREALRLLSPLIAPRPTVALRHQEARATHPLLAQPDIDLPAAGSMIDLPSLAAICRRHGVRAT
jgi:hypothetical protein